jgi:hypothetical protein
MGWGGLGAIKVVGPTKLATTQHHNITTTTTTTTTTTATTTTTTTTTSDQCRIKVESRSNARTCTTCKLVMPSEQSYQAESESVAS